MSLLSSVITLLLLTLVAPPGVTRAEDGAAEAVRRAMASTDVAEGLTMLNEAIERFPKDARLRAARAQVRLIQKHADLDGSLADADEAIRLDAGVAAGWMARGMNRTWREQWEAAAADFDRALGLGFDPLAARYRGHCRAKLGRPAEAVQDYDRALEADPDRAETLQLRAEAYVALRQFDKALADATRVVRLTPDDAARRELRGTIFLHLGRPRQAVAEFTLAIERAPREAGYWQGRAVAYHRSGQRDYALRDARRAVDLAPENGWNWLVRGQIQDDLGRPAEAHADLGEALRRLPGQASIWDARAGVAGRLGDWAGATADSRRAAELDPRNAEYWNGYAVNQIRRGDAAGAIEAATRAVDLAPGRGLFRANRAAARAETGDVAGAISDYEAALRAPDAGAVDFARAAVLAAHNGKAVRARAIARQAADRFRDAADVPTCLALADALTAAEANADDCRPLIEALGKCRPAPGDAAGVELAVGQLLLRCGDWAAARPRLERAVKAGNPAEQCRAKLLLATALARTGDAPAARATLADARQRLAALPTPAPAEASRTPAGVRLAWPDRLARELLLREAEAAAGGR